MHIAEGVLSAPVLLAGAGLAVAGTAIGLRRMPPEKVMTVALFAAAFFVATLIHVPVGPVSMHLVLNGLLGVVLGWAAFPAILVGLVLQAVLFQFGGLTTLGVNAFNMAAPAVLCHYLYRLVAGRGAVARSIGVFAAGGLALLLAATLTAASLAFTDEGFTRAAQTLLAAHLPLFPIEGLVTMFTVSFLAKVRPEALNVSR